MCYNTPMKKSNSLLDQIKKRYKAFKDGKEDKGLSALIAEYVEKAEEANFDNNAITARAIELWRSRIEETKHIPKNDFSLLDEYGLNGKHMDNVISFLKDGGSHPIFTLLVNNKAQTNPSVVFVCEIDEEKSLCIYKHALEEITK